MAMSKFSFAHKTMYTGGISKDFGEKTRPQFQKKITRPNYYF